MSQVTKLIDTYLNDNVIITSAPGNGTTSLVQAIVNELCLDHSVLYYNPSKDMNRDFIRKYYNNIFDNVVFITCELDIFLEYLINTVMNGTEFDYIVIDPGDFLLTSKGVLTSIDSIINPSKSKLICTSQIRIDVNTNTTYSTIERWNSKYIHSRHAIFKYSMWLLNVTAPNPMYSMKYLDVYDGIKVGNRYDNRYIIRVSKKEGFVI